MSELFDPAFAETLVRHASGAIYWVDGNVVVGPPPLVDVALRVELDTAPRDLAVSKKRGKLVFWRRLPDRMHAVEPGRAKGDSLNRPAEAAYVVRGRVADPAGLFNPQRFALNAVGNGVVSRLPLYRSPLGTRVPKGGVLEGSLRFGPNQPASWALVELSVPLRSATGTVVPPLRFLAQADRRGEFRLPLTLLPANDAQIKNPSSVTIRAARALIDVASPDLSLLAATRILLVEPGNTAASGTLNIRPGRSERLFTRTAGGAARPYLELVQP